MPPPAIGIGELVCGGSEVVRIEGEWKRAEWCFEEGEEGGGEVGIALRSRTSPYAVPSIESAFRGGGRLHGNHTQALTQGRIS